MDGNLMALYSVYILHTNATINVQYCKETRHKNHP
jgi:hypothetical protein